MIVNHASVRHNSLQMDPYWHHFLPDEEMKELQVWDSQYGYLCVPLYLTVSQHCVWDPVLPWYGTPLSQMERESSLTQGVSVYLLLCVMSHTGQVRVETGRCRDLGGSVSSHWLNIYCKCVKSVWSQTAAVNYWNDIMMSGTISTGFWHLMCYNLYGHFILNIL